MALPLAPIIARLAAQKALKEAFKDDNVSPSLGLSVQTNIDQVTKGLNKIQRKQIPFALSNALNRTVYSIVQEEKKAANEQFDRPVPFTLRAFRYNKATKRTLKAEVYINKIQREYLAKQIRGGLQEQPVIPTPVNLRVNKYGNIPGLKNGKIRKLLARPDTFRAIIRGVDGVWQRQKRGGLKLLIAINRQIRYRPRFTFYKTAERHARKEFGKEFDKALAYALRTAK